VAKRKAEETEPQNIFENLHFSTIPLGSLKGQVRRDIIRNRLIENGGADQVYDDNPKRTIFIADPNVDIDKLRQFVKANHDQPIIDVAWVSDCLRANKWLDLEKYIIKEDVGETPNKTHSGESSLLPPEETGEINERIAQMFDELESLVATSSDKRDTFRAMAYRRTASAVRSFNHPIRTIEDAEELRSTIGEKSIEKICEYLKTGKMKKIQYLKDDPSMAAKNELICVWGIGPSTADDLISKGIDSVEKLRQNDDLLNNNQKLGLMYYEDLLQKMPRLEVEEITDIVRGSIYQIFGSEGETKLNMIPCGSYRRGAKFCSDADYLLVWDPPLPMKKSDTLDRLVNDLTEKGYMIANFNRGWGEHAIYLGIFRAHPEKPARRIDLKIWPKNSLPYALIHFTGNADFNRKIRLYAKRRGFKLTDWTLTDPEGNHVKCTSEEDVFRELGLKYIPPESRTSSVELQAIRESRKEND